jgi:hypothetical protein
LNKNKKRSSINKEDMIDTNANKEHQAKKVTVIKDEIKK